MSDVAQFRLDLRAEILRITKEVSFGLHKKIAGDTPIDTGRAISSWNLNDGVADTSVTPLLRDKPFEDKSKGAEMLTREQALTVALTQRQKISGKSPVIVISNSLEYIEELEHGKSKQAPAGMVMKNTSHDELQLLVDQAISNRAAT